ncbi:bifunctional tetrahydrofolate synthase/dihydrofolate synthase [Pusillimonas sp. CC-YST705]|uniref:Dihydrofolate synthase/folylpolyglutamate synthase n=1 Tax=Mesopusillimonas faecipullorum TaxID=2755040 RepID=A0ABS8CAT4_9BURK|nr:bifunctional tetrahydrofolate synthase/dihydrofolate synthase [Mesopusillimonas faecipullorum]MCB5363146.1 bifunctional tetrahydrofolate synthase/dihydrofolate synthase [Mesopusillimonas faecipullorum]
MTASRPSPEASLDTWLAYLETLHPTTIELGLDRIRRVAQTLELQLPCVKITVGGTNGKGSNCAMLEAILLAAGYKVGLYTSPHLVNFNERIRINGDSLDDSAIVQQFARIDAARGETSLSYFEFATLAAMLAFQQEGVEVAILEVGLGGRLDAVNIMSADCAIVTSVDLDHVEWLGDTREAIGYEKAHIFRPGKPAICADPMPPDSLVQYAEQIGADLWRFGRDFNYSGDKQQWAYGGRDQRRRALAYPALRGANQLLNASAALAALESLQDLLVVPQQAVRVGLLQVNLPGRFQILPGRPTIVLDVAHNPHAVAALSQNLDNMGFHAYTHAVVGMVQDKDIAATLKSLVGKVDHWHCASLPGPRGASAAKLAGIVRELLPRETDEPVTVTEYENPVLAFRAAQGQVDENDRILVFGSFSTVGPVLQELGR